MTIMGRGLDRQLYFVGIFQGVILIDWMLFLFAQRFVAGLIFITYPDLVLPYRTAKIKFETISSGTCISICTGS